MDVDLMAASVRWDGLDQLLEDLRNMPTDLREEAGHIVLTVGSDAAQEIRGIYQSHSVSNNLAEHVKVEQVATGPFGAAVRVKSTARHAWLFDYGSQARHYVTEAGKVHRTGKMWGRSTPPFAFIRTAIRHRRRMYQQLRDLLFQHGATRVEGEP